MGLQALTHSAPDGRTLAVVADNVVIFPGVLTSLPFNLSGDFTPIAAVGATPLVLEAAFRNGLVTYAALVKKVGLGPHQGQPRHAVINPP